MAKSPRTTFNDDHTDSSRPAHAASPAPTLRLHAEHTSVPTNDGLDLDQVISGVEQLSQGIDGMLQRASASSIGIEPPDDLDHNDDEPMMTMFDEDAPADIRSLDLMLAERADQAMAASTVPADEPADVLAEGDRAVTDEIDLEGECEDIAALLHGSDTGTIHNDASSPDAASASTSSTPTTHEVTQQVATGTEDPAPAIPLPDLALAPTQAAGIAAALAAAAAQASAGHHPAVQEPAAAPVAAAISTQPQAPPPPATTPVAAAAVQSTPAADGREPPRRPAHIGVNLRQALAVINLPMRLLPSSAQPLVNALAITLALWAPVVFALGPMLWQSNDSATAPQSDPDQPRHAESSLHASDDSHAR